ncbi:MAG: zinc ribbon domain-containing protein [Actinomycetota bacterium]|nr:zinc ribbon domain-containing protein [Actinomycetota bacterium]
MPAYEYRCTTCDAQFELRRPMAESDAPTTCPDGHRARRIVSAFATVGASSAMSSGVLPAAAPGGGGGGCCGGGCGCG